MTNEEAIRTIEEHIVHHWIGKYPHIRICEALEMAIAALRQNDDKWVSVTKELPNGECLAVSMLPGQPAYKEMLLGYVKEKGGWKTGFICESEREILPNVTHWMKPGLPNEKMKFQMNNNHALNDEFDFEYIEDDKCTENE